MTENQFTALLNGIRAAQEAINNRLIDIQTEIAKARQKQQEMEAQQKAIQKKQEEMQEIIDKKDNRVRAILKRIEEEKK